MKWLAAVAMLVASAALAEDLVALKVTCNQKDADVYIDGDLAGKVTDPIKVSAGKHTLVVVKTGFTDYQLALTIPKFITTKSLMIDLKPGISMFAGRIEVAPGKLFQQRKGEKDDGRWTYQNGVATFKGSVAREICCILRPNHQGECSSCLTMMSVCIIRQPANTSISPLGFYQRVPADGKWHTLLVAADRAESFGLIDGSLASGVGCNLLYSAIYSKTNEEISLSIKDCCHLQITPAQFQQLKAQVKK